MNQLRYPLFVFLLVLGLALATTARADDRQALAEMLDWFLANVNESATHERFWADDLVYTSSDGSRFGKPAILEGLGDAGADAEGPTYAATDVDIRMYGDTAVIAFRLVAFPGGKADPQEERMEYFNTGTFLKRDGEWRAVAWQATRIPPES
jgi:Domain of unknown function (DUF4440)